MTEARPPAPASPPGRWWRRVDAGALLLIAAGVAVYLYAQHGMSRIAAGHTPRTMGGPNRGWNVDDWYNLYKLSRVGLGLAGAGVVISIVALAWMTLRRKPVPIDEQADDSRPS